MKKVYVYLIIFVLILSLFFLFYQSFSISHNSYFYFADDDAFKPGKNMEEIKVISYKSMFKGAINNVFNNEHLS
jgi:hypothetical protein